MKTLKKSDEPVAITPPVHLEFIQNQTVIAGATGVEEVEAYHKALFLHQHAREIERAEQEIKHHENRLAHLSGRLGETQSRLAAMDKLLPAGAADDPEAKPGTPWNGWDLAMFTAAALGIAGLLVFGILNISFNLLESGLVTFTEHPYRAYLWAALLPVGALAVKIGWDFLRGPRLRAAYTWTCLLIGLAGVAIWVGTYALVYPTLSRSPAEEVASLSVFDNSTANSLTSGGVKKLDAMIVASQAIAEIFLSAVLGIYMTVLCARHRVPRLAHNPHFMQLDTERTELERGVEQSRLALGEARGQRTRLESQQTALVAYARSLFLKETALKQDQTHQKRILLEQIAEQLRGQLQGIEPKHDRATTQPALNGN